MLQTDNNLPHALKRIIALLLWISLSLIFLYSAYSKLFVGFNFHKSFFSVKNNFFLDAFIIDVDAFDRFRWTFLDIGINSMIWAGVLARLMIGFEFMLGFLLLFRIRLRKFTLPLVILILVLFIVYLLYVMAVHGNNSDCGCFGSKITMTPLMAIWKNLLLIIAAGLLMFLHEPSPGKKDRIWVPVIIAMLALAGPFLMNPLGDDMTPVTVVDEPIDLSPLYAANPAPTIELRTGKHIVAFMSLTCPHCKKAAYLLETIHHGNPSLSIFIVLAGHPDNEKEFFKSSQAEDIPHILFKDRDTFSKFTEHPIGEKSYGVPAIYWINNSMIERKSSYYQLDPKEISNWMQQK